MRSGQHIEKFYRKFLEKAERRFGTRFNYDKVQYKDSQTKVTITCRLHGDFSVKPNNFLHKTYGCRLCANENMHKERGAITDLLFIQRASDIHDNKYDYKRIVFENLNSYLEISCPVHGIFTQQAWVHLNGGGCKNCNLADGTRRYDTEAFIKAAKTVHGEAKFEYYMAKYVSGHEPVTIICPKHGLFEQEASGHLSGQGCPKCDIESRLIGIDEFIRRAQEIHGDRYGYLRSEYVKYCDPITITCGIHGDFQQRVSSHLAGGGCQRCAWGPTSKKCADWLAFVAVQTGRHIHHAENGGEYHFPEMPKRKADGFDEIANTVLEFNGSLFHGDPRRYPADQPHPLIAKKTCGEIYQKTLDRDQWIRDQGYTLVTMWEMEWDAAVKAVIRLQRLWRQRKGMSNGRRRIKSSPQSG